MERANKKSGARQRHRTSNADEISDTCFSIVTHDYLACNGHHMATEYSGWLQIANLLDSDGSSHVGRKNAPALLAARIESGQISEKNAAWLKDFAALCGEEPQLTIDPLIEAARRILLVRFLAGGGNG
ncbi:hypothetical protein [Devosia sp.]|uniref:hypothetical protein n=1 Tax=Devosia sp. TaxID=1871048 RepID=UPI003A91678D